MHDTNLGLQKSAHDILDIIMWLPYPGVFFKEHLGNINNGFS